MNAHSGFIRTVHCNFEAQTSHQVITISNVRPLDGLSSAKKEVRIL